MTRSCPAWRNLAGAVALAAAVLAGHARADDTEIFLAADAATDTTGGGANILFIIDTSASMDAEVSTQVPWNPATNFSGCYRSDALYLVTGTDPPPCDSTAWVQKTGNRCAASAAGLAGLGQYTAFALGWDASRERWDPPEAEIPDRLLECEADRGVDGEGSERYAANGADGPWGPDATNEPAWNSQVTLYDGNWLNWRTNPPSVTRTRLEVVQDVVVEIVTSLQNANVGLMRFNRDEGGAVTQAITDVSASRSEMTSAVRALTTAGRTPLSETLYEATLYFSGGNVDYGNIGPARSVAAARVGGSPTGTAYRSPIDEDCQKNFVILLTDGEPNSDTSANAKIAALPDFASLVGSCDGSGDGACLDDLAAYLHLADLDARTPGLQNVTTYTIGFGGVDAPILENSARRGGGQYYLADDTGSLAAVLRSIVAGIVDRAGTFTAPALPANLYNRGTTDRDAYVSVFEPTGTTRWPGNLKKYRFVDDTLLGQNGRPAVSPGTGFFLSDAFSFWSGEPDGDRIDEGGAASRLVSAAGRRLYTDLAGNDLTADANRVDTGNSRITAALLGVAGAAERDELIRWIAGDDVTDADTDGDLDEARRQMGDPLHVRPVVLDYGTTSGSAETVVFVATNAGVLHAFDAATGTELWGYLPSRLLDRQAALLADSPTLARRYGLDGEMRLHIEGNDGAPGLSGAERAILVFGMGRGGDAVYALDVTERREPRRLWTIDSDSEGFDGIGQTWAAPEVARVRVDDSVRTVAILSGGYDDSQDNDAAQTDEVGNAVYMVDLIDGDLVWSAGSPGEGHDLALDSMQHSIPAAPRVIDLTRDGLADRFYVGDMGGRVWRFDIRNGASSGDLVEGGVLASLGAADLDLPVPAAEVRRFYNTPDVVFVNCARGTFLAVNLGSGHRGHPLDTDIEDAFFSIRDRNIFGVLDRDAYEEPVRFNDLADITGIPSAIVPRDSPGWLLRLTEADGEKVLGEATTFRNTLFFTSFSPGGAIATCVGGIGVNRAYEVDVCSGNAVTNLDGGTETLPLGTDDRFRILNQAGIAPESVFLPSTGGDGPTRCIGLSCFPTGEIDRARRTFWSQQQSAD
ncbi:MAG: hypothetical protein FJ197_07215 [Gammaproteobacteria bacterium]|nr:hypothetical protein [Gammaproteobacteria bacterium]